MSLKLKNFARMNAQDTAEEGKYVEVHYPSKFDCLYENNNSQWPMKPELPDGLFVHKAPKEKKGEKKTFFCDICLLELNSVDTRNSHKAGVKHQKKLTDMEYKYDRLWHRGEITRKQYNNMPTIKGIPNPAATKMKVPVHLHEKIKETCDPIVGLNFITEWIAKSDPEMEPHYECQLCGKQGISNSMYDHMMGKEHCLLFAKKIGARVGESSRALLQFAKENAENQEQISSMITTIRSNE